MITSDQGIRARVWTASELEEFRRLCALRAQLSGFAASEAATRVAAGASARPLELAYRAMCEAARATEYAHFLDADMNFHRTVAEMAGVPLMSEMWELLEAKFRDYTTYAQRALVGDLEEVAAAHRLQFETIQAGQSRAAQWAVHVDLDVMWHLVSVHSAVEGIHLDPVAQVCCHVMQNLHQPLTLAAMAREVAHLSTSYLAKQFRAKRGQNFTEYLQGLRLRRAAVLLETSDLPVQTIATRVGYGDVSRFGVHFRRRYGLAPTAFRQNSNSHEASAEKSDIA